MLHKLKNLSFEYRVPQPADALIPPIIEAISARRFTDLKKALKTFTDAGYNLDAIQIEGRLFPSSSASNFSTQSLLQQCLHKPRYQRKIFTLLVEAGANPFTPQNYLAKGVTGDQGGETDDNRWLWKFLLPRASTEHLLSVGLNDGSPLALSYLDLALRYQNHSYPNFAFLNALTDRLGWDGIGLLLGPRSFEAFRDHQLNRVTHTVWKNGLAEWFSAWRVHLERAELNTVAATHKQDDDRILAASRPRL